MVKGYLKILKIYENVSILLSILFEICTSHKVEACECNFFFFSNSITYISIVEKALHFLQKCGFYRKVNKYVLLKKN